jgi:hypothetical protein
MSRDADIQVTITINIGGGHVPSVEACVDGIGDRAIDEADH